MYNMKATTKELDLVAETILEHLGGEEFRRMTGARDLLSTAEAKGARTYLRHGVLYRELVHGLMFKCTKGKDGIDKVVIRHDKELDLYDIEFWNMNKFPKKPTGVGSLDYVHGRDLRDVFTANTGLPTKEMGE